MTHVTLDGTPASGAVAARVAASAASLLELAADRSRTSWSEAPGAVAQARTLARRASELGTRDLAAYAGAREALAAAQRGAEEGRVPGNPAARRDYELGRSVAAAADPPLELAACAADVAQLAVTLARHCEPAVRADVVVAAKLAAAVADGAAHLFEVNLVAGADSGRVALVRQRAALAATAARAALGEGAP